LAEEAQNEGLGADAKGQPAARRGGSRPSPARRGRRAPRWQFV